MNYKLEIEDSSKVFFISDFHARHENIIKFCGRPWLNKEEMTEALINNWNSVISPDDIVFNLGDFIWSGSYGAIIPKLNGHIHLILGNHDRHINPTWEKYLAGIYEQLTLLIDNKIVYLNHFPYLCFPANAYQLFGHVHLSKIKNNGQDFERCKYLLPNQYDVGIDFNNFKPISWKEVKSRIEYQIKNNINCLIWLENENNKL